LPIIMQRSAVLWYRIAMMAGGFGLGLFADRRPFGETVLTHPIVVFAALAGVGLLILRMVLMRPVPEVIPERTLVIGFLLGFAAFLVGNWLGVQVLSAR
jgi:hypothetical protein